tara:strand:- start:31 stop:660 length:630 start_codon:yes stop_codon:yes gene_type:complete
MAAETTPISRSIQRLDLLCLPAELRNQIWKHTLSGMIFEVYSWPSYNIKKIATRILNRQKNFLSLLMTCRQIHIEANLSPFKFNAFRFKSEDAIPAFLDRFDASKREAITEIHMVTWRAMYMVESSSYFPKGVLEVLTLRSLPGLRRLCVEVRLKSNRRGWEHARCDNRDAEVALVEKGLRDRLTQENGCIEVVFVRSFYATVAASHVL